MLMLLILMPCLILIPFITTIIIQPYMHTQLTLITMQLLPTTIIITILSSHTYKREVINHNRDLPHRLPLSWPPDINSINTITCMITVVHAPAANPLSNHPTVT